MRPNPWIVTADASGCACRKVNSMQTLFARAKRIANEVARPRPTSVDRDARFPHEAFAALRDERLLAAAIPRELGGLGCSAVDISAICSVLGRACSSTAAIFAMHQIQLVSIARHSTRYAVLRRLPTEGRWSANGSSLLVRLKSGLVAMSGRASRRSNRTAAAFFCIRGAVLFRMAKTPIPS